MSLIKILHCADFHIGASMNFLGDKKETSKYETLITFEKVIDTAQQQNVDVILIAGDLFDSLNIEKEFFDAVIKTIAIHNSLKIVYCAGNHDPLNIKSPFYNNDLPENLFILKTNDDVIEFDDLKLRIYGKSFEYTYMKGSENFSIKPINDDYINIMLVHSCLSNDLSSNYNPITPSFIKNSLMNYIALGHIHKRSDIGRIDNTFFAYSGCAEGHGFDELGPKGVYIGEIGKGVCNLTFAPMSKRIYVNSKFDITGFMTSNQIVDFIIPHLKESFGENFKENLYKIELCGEVSSNSKINTAEIIARLSDKIYFVKLVDNTSSSFDLDELSKELSLKGIFAKKFKEKIDSASEEEKIALKQALTIGLKAFNSEVTLNEN